MDDTMVYEGHNLLRRVTLRFPDDALAERHVEDHGYAVAMLPCDPERRTALLVTTPRPAVIDANQDDITGSLGDEDLFICTRRDALKEAGVALSEVQRVSTVWSIPTLSLERIHLFLARYVQCDRIGPVGRAIDENENVAAHEIPLHLLMAQDAKGSITDLRTLSLIQALQVRQPVLFDRPADADEAR